MNKMILCQFLLFTTNFYINTSQSFSINGLRFPKNELNCNISVIITLYFSSRSEKGRRK